MYPWQSGSHGREETQRMHLNPNPDAGCPTTAISSGTSTDHRLQRVAALSRDWKHAYLRFSGAELLIEIARFWASIGDLQPKLDRYEILGVMGPDEYHDAYAGADRPGVDNNTYTNVMAVWVICGHAGDRRAAAALPPGGGGGAGVRRRRARAAGGTSRARCGS